MKKETIIYTILCSLMMTSAAVASNDDILDESRDAYRTPKTKKAVSRITKEEFTPTSFEKLRMRAVSRLESEKREEAEELQAQAEKNRLLEEVESKKQAQTAKHEKELEELKERLRLLSLTQDETLAALREQNQKLMEEKKALEDAQNMSEKEQLRIQQEIAEEKAAVAKLTTELATAQQAATQDATAIEKLKTSLASKEKVIKALDLDLDESAKKYAKIKKDYQEANLRAAVLEEDVKLAEQEKVQIQEKLASYEHHVFGDQEKSTASTSNATTSGNRRSIKPISSTK
ncbi:MAG: hypothetical protein J0H12_01110 [Candidatus Paracaedimonas acanthamoebae]|uniref:Chromosome partition protein Smc n=1 Tax=Candidatus Paracaedimonas acanthamoebae TaxID=244581 RepID=A0A8J7TV09_9PROT|nr:hypothetical protein [Candidatus Paracaedimonas acanthamoebae]